MKSLPPDIHRAVWAALHEGDRARTRVADLINNPEGKRPEQLEDALNELQDAAYRARRAFRVEAVR